MLLALAKNKYKTQIKSKQSRLKFQTDKECAKLAKQRDQTHFPAATENY